MSLAELRRPSALAPATAEAVRTQAVRVDPGWWQTALLDGGLEARPLRVSLDDHGRTVLRRSDIWDVAKDRDYDVLDLLWHSIAWGAGSYRRLCRQRIETVQRDRTAAIELLEQARSLAGSQPANAYELLHPNGKGRLRYLGPAFGTKFLYFAGAGEPTHRSLILDSRVATSLRNHAQWTGLANSGWSAETYERYCDTLEEWRLSDSLDSAAQWELALFDLS